MRILNMTLQKINRTHFGIETCLKTRDENNLNLINRTHFGIETLKKEFGHNSHFLINRTHFGIETLQFHLSCLMPHFN